MSVYLPNLLNQGVNARLLVHQCMLLIEEAHLMLIYSPFLFWRPLELCVELITFCFFIISETNNFVLKSRKRACFSRMKLFLETIQRD